MSIPVFWAAKCPGVEPWPSRSKKLAMFFPSSLSVYQPVAGLERLGIDLRPLELTPAACVWRKLAPGTKLPWKLLSPSPWQGLAPTTENSRLLSQARQLFSRKKVSQEISRNRKRCWMIAAPPTGCHKGHCYLSQFTQPDRYWMNLPCFGPPAKHAEGSARH